MTARITRQPVRTNTPASPSQGMLLRTCACGGPAGASGTCATCQQRKLLGKPLQTKLRINEPGDRYEQEADHLAEQVMRMPEMGKDERQSGRAPAAQVQRRAAGGEAGVGEFPPSCMTCWRHRDSHSTAARAFFEPRFGHDFGNVRVHVDAKAAESARAVDVQAYTVGNDIVFTSGRIWNGRIDWNENSLLMNWPMWRSKESNRQAVDGALHREENDKEPDEPSRESGGWCAWEPRSPTRAKECMDGSR